LFVERAAATNGFVLDDTTAPVVSAICTRLDGIPLAIEMAVPRLNVLTLSQLAERLNERFRLLAAPGRAVIPRHRTLRAVIDWSYDLLSLAERTLLHALSVFSGGADLAAIQAVVDDGAGGEWALLDRLTGLADKSLVTVDNAPTPRFRLLETVRQYAADKLKETGETALRARHAVSFAHRFAEAAARWPTMPGPAWLAAYAMDTNNLRSALAWCFGPDGDRETGLLLVASSVPLWWELPETPLAEGRRWLDIAAAHLDATTPDRVRGWVRFGQSWRDFRFGDRENLPAALEAAAHFRAGGERAGLGAALWRAGSVLLTRETAADAEACLIEAEAVLRQEPGGKWLALALIRLGDLRFRQGLPERALASYQEGFALSQATDFWIGLVNGGSNMAELLFDQGDADRALRQLRQLRDDLPVGRRTPLMATLTAHLLLAGEMEEMRGVGREAISQGAAIGLTAALAWTIEAVALQAATVGKLVTAAQLAGYVRTLHPAAASRAGSRRAVAEQLEERLQTGLPPAELAWAVGQGGRWAAWSAAEMALLVLG
jgi:hypothetical protein